LDPSIHDRQTFSCETEALNDYLRTQAYQAQKKGISASHVLVREDHPETIIGFVTLVTTEIPISEPAHDLAGLPKTRHSLSALLLARMAVDARYERQEHGEFLLKFVFKTACEIADLASCAVIVVDAKSDKIASFYTKYGFIASASRPLRFHIATETVR